MAANVDQDSKKQRLLDDLLQSVKECQVRYGGKSELATENEGVIANLCIKFEAVLNHGLKTNVGQNSLKEKVANLIVDKPVKLSSWPFVRLHLNRHDLERFMLLKQVTTDNGRAKAWLRSSLNEHSLERYFHILITDHENLNNFYEPTAFMQDSERTSVLPQMAAGLSSVLFAIKIDSETLNQDNTTDILNNDSEEALLAMPSKKSSTINNSVINKKMIKKKGSAQVISFDEEEIKAKLLSVNSKDPANHSVITNHFDENSHRHFTQNNSISEQDRLPSPSMAFDDVHLDSRHASSSTNDDNDGYKSPSDALSFLSVDTSSGHDDSVTKLVNVILL